MQHRRPPLLSRLARAAAAAILLAGALAAGTAAGGSSATGTQLQLLARLRSAAEHPAGYDRALFPHWIDADGDGCTTRYEVLIKESTRAVSVGSGCYLTGGKWYSAYDGAWSTNPTTFDIDHLVALKEAWDSGAWSWSTARRRAYANDLGYGATLRAVSAASNRSKSDKDPAQWLPSRTAFRCTYATQWVAVKTRWNLAVDAAERSALRSLLASCPVRTLTVPVV